jgi:hypothetical protein
MKWVMVNMILVIGWTIVEIHLYKGIRFGVVFMTILTDIREVLLLECRYREGTTALASLFPCTSSSAPLQITCT